MKITFTSLNREDKTRSTGIRPKSGETEQSCIARAVTKLYGKRAFWNGDYSMPMYGQVFDRLGDGSASSRTGRMRIDIE